MSTTSTTTEAIISPSLLSADFGALAQDCQKMLLAGADTLHVDVMDGNFVPNISFGIPAVRAVKKHTENFEYEIEQNGTKITKKGAFLDCHLMVANPKQWLPTFADIGIHGFTFHYESLLPNANSNDSHETTEQSVISLLKDIKSRGIRSGLALKPKTSIDVLTPSIAEHCDMILIMTVEPGFGGQKFMADMMPKVQKLRSLYPGKLIQVDGGIDVNTIQIVADAGANVVVSGSGVFGAPSPSEAITIMRNTIHTSSANWNKTTVDE